MRVIAGIARSMPLKAAEGDNTRPTTDRIKETLFNMLQSDIAGCRFLDLYSGSGENAILSSNNLTYFDKNKEKKKINRQQFNEFLKFLKVEKDN